jgi:hypothetical protein
MAGRYWQRFDSADEFREFIRRFRGEKALSALIVRRGLALLSSGEAKYIEYSEQPLRGELNQKVRYTPTYSNRGARKMKNPSVGWNVYLRGKLIDTVFFTTDYTAEEVKRSLVQHDGYDPGITMRRERRKNPRPSNLRMTPSIYGLGTSNLFGWQAKNYGYEKATSRPTLADVRAYVLAKYPDFKVSRKALGTFTKMAQAAWDQRKNPSRVLPVGKWRKARVRRIPGGKYQVKIG